VSTPTVRLAGPEAIAAVVPTLLGFHPSDGDAVLVTFVDRRVKFTARIAFADIHGDGDARQLARSVRRGVPDATHAVLVGYTADEHLPLNLAGTLWRAGLNVADVLRVHDGQVTCRDGCTHPLPEDPARAAAVASGQVVAESRDALYRLVEHTGEPLTDAQTDVAGRIVDLGQRDRMIAHLARLTGEDLLAARETYLAIGRHHPSTDLRRDQALALAAVASYLAGDTAIASVALDGVTPGHRLALLLRTAIGAAIPPAALREMLASAA
jgi:hypothetical protein